MTSAAIAGVAILVATNAAIAGDVEFDPKAAIERRLVDHAADSAEECVRGQLRASLYRGVRDRNTLINAAATPCEPILRGMLVRINPSFAAKPGIHDIIVETCNRQLDEIIAVGE